MAWIYLTGFIFLSPRSLKALKRLPCAGGVLAEHDTTRGNDVVTLIALKDHDVLNFDRQNLNVF